MSLTGKMHIFGQFGNELQSNFEEYLPKKLDIFMKNKSTKPKYDFKLAGTNI